MGVKPAYAQAARDLGTLLGGRGIGLVYGGGRVGLMGVLADATLAHGGEVIGVIPQALVDRELAHRGVTELRVVHSMHQRKALMAELSEAFVALPGGYGTLEELCEVLTWSQLGLHRKPCGLLNTDGFYDPLLGQIDAAVKAQFIPLKHRSLLQVHSQPGPLLEQLLQFEPPSVEQWINLEET
jgi:uncharacterized protein (TIGR00730 family)